MKKLIYIVLFAMATSFTVTSCTEEVVQPTQNENPGTGDGQGGKI